MQIHFSEFKVIIAVLLSPFLHFNIKLTLKITLYININLRRREYLYKQALSKTPLEYTNEMRNIWVSIIVNMIISGVFLNKSFLRPPGARQWNGEYWSNDNWEHNYFGCYTKQALSETPLEHVNEMGNIGVMIIESIIILGVILNKPFLRSPIEQANEMRNIWVSIIVSIIIMVVFLNKPFLKHPLNTPLKWGIFE